MKPLDANVGVFPDHFAEEAWWKGGSATALDPAVLMAISLVPIMHISSFMWQDIEHMASPRSVCCRPAASTLSLFGRTEQADDAGPLRARRGADQSQIQSSVFLRPNLALPVVGSGYPTQYLVAMIPPSMRVWLNATITGTTDIGERITLPGGRTQQNSHAAAAAISLSRSGTERHIETAAARDFR
jgi:hypothetical protein